MNIKKGDTVVVLSGKDKGKREKVIFASPSIGKLRVENVMVMKRHTKRTQKFQGGIVEKPALIPVSKVMLICPLCLKPTRVGLKIEKSGKKVRVCKKCNEVVDKDK
jgi:large subunit ribosomal protein L24